jgi:HSP20 family protein
MKLIRSNPFNCGLSRVADFDDWFRSPFAAFPALARAFDPREAFGGNVGSLATDVHEDKDNYFARFEVPGVKKEDVKVELNDRVLTVTVEKKEKQGEAESSYTFTRSISVPESVKSDAIGAKLEDGVLVVTLPKTEERKPKSIEVL